MVRPPHLRLGERVAHAEECLVASRAVGDQLRDHRVVGHADLVALFDSSVHSDSSRQGKALDPAGLRQERARVLRVEPDLDRVAVEPRLVHGQRLARCDAELFANEIDSRDELGHRMLHLNASVQLQEPEVAAVQHELRRPRAAVADRTGEGDGGRTHPSAQVGVERRGR